jgi:hypothetical protein
MWGNSGRLRTGHVSDMEGLTHQRFQLVVGLPVHPTRNTLRADVRDSVSTNSTHDPSTF